MKHGIWLLMLALGISTLALAGCEDDDDSSADPATTAGTGAAGGITNSSTGSGTNAPAGGSSTSGGSTSGGTIPPAVTSLVLCDFSQNVDGGSSFGYLTDPVPAHGRARYTATWTAIDLLDHSPLDITLTFELSSDQGIATSVPLLSPVTASVFIGAGMQARIIVANPNPATRATVQLRVDWTAD